MAETNVNKRFADVSAEEIDDIVDRKDSKSTKKCVTSSATLFNEFLRESGVSCDINQCSEATLDEHLRKFYASVRTKKGDLFKTSTFQYLRYGLSRYIKSKTGIDVCQNECFNSSREVYRAVLVDMKKKGFGTTDHTPAISPEDMKQLYAPGHLVFATTVPVGLQRKVWFELMMYLCRRGRENLRDMTRDTFCVDTDACGRRYVYQKQGEFTKKHRETDRPDDTTGEGRMYELPGNDLCPVLSFEKYITKLNPHNKAMWQRPCDTFAEDEPWYTRSPLGKNTLGTMMSSISNTACLSKTYTNHSIRATAITALDDAGVEARHIMRTTGHKSESSIRSYSHRVCDAKKRSISDTLSAARNAPECSTSGTTCKQPFEPTQENNISMAVTQRKSCPSASTSESYIHDAENLDYDIQDLLSLTDSQMEGISESVRRSPVASFSPRLLNNTNITKSTSDQRMLNFCPNLYSCNVTMNVYGGMPGQMQ